jgi:hypothetical protein
LHYFIQSHDKEETRSVKQKQKSWAQKLETDFQPVKETADKFSDQLRRILRNGDENYLTLLTARLEAARGYFEPLITDFSQRVHKQIKLMEMEKKAKGYLAELKDLERMFFKLRQGIYKTEELIRSSILDTEFSREALLSTPLYAGKVSKNEKIEENEKKVKGGNNIRKGKNEKVVKNGKNTKEARAGSKEDVKRTSEVSFDLYKEGKSIQEIAAERSLTAITIEGHLAQYIAKGLIDVFNLVDPDKVAKIMEVADELNTLNLSPLKERLGADYSYTELRYAMAYRMSGASRK